MDSTHEVFHIRSCKSFAKTENEEVKIGFNVCMNVSKQQWSDEAGPYGGRNP